MAAGKNRWEDLDDEIRGRREADPPTAAAIKNRIIVQMKRLSKGKHCSETVQGWFDPKRNGGLVELVVSEKSDAIDSWKRPAIRLRNLHHLKDGAVLSLMITVSEKSPKGIRAYTIGIEGKTRSSNIPWYARIDLTQEPEGKGCCGHPLLHCHIGSTPDPDEVPEPAGETREARRPGSGADEKRKTKAFSPRVPLPWLSPEEALEWLLATVDSSLEPDAAGALRRVEMFDGELASR